MSERSGPSVFKAGSGEAFKRGVLTVHELLSGKDSSNISVAVVEVNGINRSVRNKVSEAVYYILEGSGVFTVAAGEIHELNVKVGEVIHIRPGTIFQDRGNMKMLAIYSPPFDPDQVETVDLEINPRNE